MKFGPNNKKVIIRFLRIILSLFSSLPYPRQFCYSLFTTLFFQLFQVVDEIQVLQRKGSRKLRQLNFEISKHINPARDAARKERYNKIAQKYQ